MRIAVEHRIVCGFEPPVDRLALRLRLVPAAHAGQTVAAWSVTVNGRALDPVGTDAFGHPVMLWTAKEPVATLDIVAGGEVETSDTAGVVREPALRVPPGVFLRETPLTAPGAAVRAIAAKAGEGDLLGRLHALSQAVGEALAQRLAAEAAEGTERPAPSARDLSHLFIAAARVLGVPARYVTGYLLGAEGEQPEPHAWAEAMVPGLGWVGFDASRNLCPTDAYVRLGCGFDAADAEPIAVHSPFAPEVTRAASIAVAARGGTQ